MSYHDDMFKQGRQSEIGREPVHMQHAGIEDYRNVPVSINELRSERSGHAKDLTAREMLVGLLRDIDSGKIETPDFAVVCMCRRTEGMAILTTERVGGVQNPLEVYGLLWRSALRLCEDTQS